MKANVNTQMDIKYVDGLLDSTAKTETAVQDIRNTCFKSIIEAMETLREISDSEQTITWLLDDDESFIELYEAAVELGTAMLTMKSALRKYRNMALGKK